MVRKKGAGQAILESKWHSLALFRKFAESETYLQSSAIESGARSNL